MIDAIDIVLDPWLSRSAAAKYLSMSTRTFDRRVKVCDMLRPKGHDERHPRWRRSQLDAYLMRVRREGSELAALAGRVACRYDAEFAFHQAKSIASAHLRAVQIKGQK